MNDPEKRFLFFSSLFLMAFIVGGLVTYQTINFHKVFLITAIGTFVWAMFEHESSLSSKKLYISNDKIISWTSGRDYFVLSFSLKERVLLIL